MAGTGGNLPVRIWCTNVELDIQPTAGLGRERNDRFAPRNAEKQSLVYLQFELSHVIQRRLSTDIRNFGRARALGFDTVEVYALFAFGKPSAVRR